MPYRRKDSPVLWASYTDASGRRVRRTTGTTDRKEAEALEAKWKLEAFKQQQWGEEPSHTYDELMLAYLKETVNEKRCPENDHYHGKPLYRWFSGRELSTIQAADIRGYIDMRRQEGKSPATINRELSLLSAAINYARREWEWDIPNPVSGRMLKEPEGRVRWISQVEADVLIRAAESEPKAPWLAHFIRLGLHTGCRKGEILGLEWSRVDLQEGVIYLEAVHTKAGKRRSVPMNAIAREAIMQLLRFRAEHAPGTPWVFCNKQGRQVRSIKRSFSTACKKAGIENFRIHDLRHTCASWLVTAGVPLTEVREVLGHSSVTMTERYAHLAPENVRAAVAVLEGNVSRLGHVDETGKVLKIR